MERHLQFILGSGERRLKEGVCEGSGEMGENQFLGRTVGRKGALKELYPRLFRISRQQE